jgi:phosphopantothenoylcysteine decarboxylase/phosphopantothenate--cysteine ligase
VKSFQGRRILVGITGSIAAVKVPELVHELKKEGARVNCAMTPAASHFVTPLSLATLSGESVFHQMSSAESFHMPHLTLAEHCDAYLVVPASADAIAKLAAGWGDDPVCLCALTTPAPVLLAPAMHPTLWKHPATQANVKRLKGFGCRFVGPVSGGLADGSSGLGRMSEPPEILEALRKILPA